MKPLKPLQPLLLLSILICIQGKTQEKSSNDRDTGRYGSDRPEGKSEKESIAGDASAISNITYLNAANFDFSNNLGTTYLGKLNLFAPNIGGSKFGFVAGIMKIRFNFSDTTHASYLIDRQLLNPLDSLKAGTRYLRQFNKYVTTRSNDVWSFYVQPMFRVLPGKSDRQPNNKGGLQAYPNGIYLHLHFELLVNKTNVTSNISTLQQDTLMFDSSLPRGAFFRAFPVSKLVDDRTFLNGYFGGGVTFALQPFNNENSRFFFQTTLGITTNYPSWTNQDISSTVLNVLPTRDTTGRRPLPSYEPASKAFFLIRAEFTQNLNDKAQIIVGTDIRGLLPRYNPQYATYVGLNVSLEALSAIITGSTKSNNSSLSSAKGQEEKGASPRKDGDAER